MTPPAIGPLRGPAINATAGKVLDVYGLSQIQAARSLLREMSTRAASLSSKLPTGEPTTDGTRFTRS